MRYHQIIAATLLAAAALVAMRPASGGADDGAPGLSPVQSSCTPEARKCMEKLAALGYPASRGLHWPGSEQAILGLLESDPHCAMVLWGTLLP